MDFHALFDSEFAAVYRYLAHRLGDAAAAEDLAAETFLRAYQARATFRPGSPRAWLFTIATNLLRDHARGRVRHDAAFAALAGRRRAGRRRTGVPRPGTRSRTRRAAPRGTRGTAAVRVGRTVLRGDRDRDRRRGRHRPLAPVARPRPTDRRARSREEPEMTPIDDRLRAAHARVPSRTRPRSAAFARVWSRGAAPADAAAGRDPRRRLARRAAPPRSRSCRRGSRARSLRRSPRPHGRCAAAGAPRPCLQALSDVAAAQRVLAAGRVYYARNDFTISITYIGADGRPTARSRRRRVRGVAHRPRGDLARARRLGTARVRRRARAAAGRSCRRARVACGRSARSREARRPAGELGAEGAGVRPRRARARAAVQLQPRGRASEG